MTAFLPNPKDKRHSLLRKLRGRVCAGAGLTLALLALTGCATTAAPPAPRDALEPLPKLAAQLPSETSLAARDLATALFLEEAGASAAPLARIRELEAQEPGLLPWALDAEIALLPDARARRHAYRQLLERDDLPATLRTRLQVDVADDPLLLAKQRIRDGRIKRFGGMANALAASVGSNLENPVLLPLRIARVLTRIGISEHKGDELSTAERQALLHFKNFVAENADARETAALLETIETQQERWFETKREQNLRGARAALERGNANLAAALAERALRYTPESRDAQKLLAEANRLRAHREQERARSLEAAPVASKNPDTPAARAEAALLEALWLPDADIAASARALLETAPRGARADEARFALAIADIEAGHEIESWATLEALARGNSKRSNMARHARALVTSLEANPYGGFLAARAASRSKRARWLMFGPLAEGARDHDLPRPVEWLVEIPSTPAVVLGLPQRLIGFPFLPETQRSPGVLARRYLARSPDGAHAETLRAWLIEHERERGNFVSAWRMAQLSSDFEAGQLETLRARAAGQALETARGEQRHEVRLRLLRDVTRLFPDTEPGREAGLEARREIERWSSQRIRISRGFLEENPLVAGPEGLALRARYLDGEVENGELHPEGITLLGGRFIEINFVDESGDEDDEPARVRERVSKRRLERTVAQLEESAHHALRSDDDVQPEHDAARDTYFERARLGAVEHLDLRPGAASSYRYLGARERFGAVRGRESLLPVELVLRGSFSDLSLGAFPRIRLPKKTPDSLLYE